MATPTTAARKPRTVGATALATTSQKTVAAGVKGSGFCTSTRRRNSMKPLCEFAMHRT